MVVRGFIAGSTSTSMWTHYAKGVREYCGHKLPELLKKNQRLESPPLVTPTTKEKDHDRLITPKEIVDECWMTQQEWDFCSKKAMELFTFGQKVSQSHGLFLVDTKYEFGRDQEGNIILIDEIHTPDSSRYWIANTYEERFAKGETPDNIDKDILRQWYSERCDPYKDDELPSAPEDLKILLSLRYIELYERITGELFQFPPNIPTTQRLIANLKMVNEIPKQTKKAIIVVDSHSNDKWCQQIISHLEDQRCSVELFKGGDVIDIISKFEVEKKESQGKAQVVYITVPNGSSDLNITVATISTFPTITCPSLADTNLSTILCLPRHVPLLTVLDPSNCALAVKRIFDFEFVNGSKS